MNKNYLHFYIKWQILGCCWLTGVGLLYFHMYNKMKDVDSSRNLHTAGSFADAAMKMALRRRRGVSFLGGDAGPLALAAVVYQHLNRASESRSCLDRYGTLLQC